MRKCPGCQRNNSPEMDFCACGRPLPKVALSCAYAYSPRENIGSGGRDHAIVKEPVDFGRLHRKAGDALCKPARKFWGLYENPERAPSCKTCVRIMSKLAAA